MLLVEGEMIALLWLHPVLRSGRCYKKRVGSERRKRRGRRVGEESGDKERNMARLTDRRMVKRNRAASFHARIMII